MTRRITLLVLAAATGASGLLTSAAHASQCQTVSQAGVVATVCVHDDGTISCGGKVGDRMIFRCQTW